MSIERLYTVEETLDLLRISRGTLYKQIRKGLLKPIKIENKTLFPESELTRFIESLKKEESA